MIKPRKQRQSWSRGLYDTDFMIKPASFRVAGFFCASISVTTTSHIYNLKTNSPAL